MRSKTRLSVYKMITDRIIEALERGQIPWQKQWKGLEGKPQNYQTGHAYTGINFLLASMTPADTPYFLTFNQAKKLGGHVKKGSHSLPIVFWNAFYVNTETGKRIEHIQDGMTNIEQRFTCRYYNVFNITDIEGIDYKKIDEIQTGSSTSPIEAAEEIIRGYPNPPTIRHNGRPGYSPAIDRVTIPSMHKFSSPDFYYMTFFHELIHSTGHKSRLNREGVQGTHSMEDPEYALEELIAEIGRCFLATEAGLDNDSTREQAESYIAHWLMHLRNDHRFIFKAASRAKKAVSHILNITNH